MVAMHHYAYAFVSAFLLLAATTEGAKILAMFSFPGKSHVGAYQPLMEELARRGHEVTVVTAFPRKQPLANYKEIIYEDTFPPRDSSGMNFFQMQNIPAAYRMFFMQSLIMNSCEKFLQRPSVQELMHSTDLKFDLVIYETFFTQCTYGFLHKFKVPSIAIVPNTLVSWMSDNVGNPSTQSYIPDIMNEHDNMDIISKVFTFVHILCMNLIRHFSIEPKMDAIMRKYFPDPTIPSISALESNVSFLFLHSHPILNYPRPLTPNTIEVGGLHIGATKKLPQDLQKLLDDTPQGVIYFSLGSNVRSVDMPEEMRNALLKSFSKLKQKVLWKWEADSLPGQPKNVHLSKWLPQNDILAHPNVKLFMTHGGLMSLQEASYFGVPLIAIPVTADQKFNAIAAQKRGQAIVLEVKNITEASLDWALHEIQHEPRYRETAQRISLVFRDQPQKPLERAVYWVEYAIRHKGAPHMRSAALDLNFFQYYLLDVIAVLSLVAFASVILTLLLTRALLRRLFSKPAPVSKNKKKN